MALMTALRRSKQRPEDLEVYRDLYTRILLRAGQRSGGVVLGVTSATAGEGKTTTALNLARAFAEDRRLTGRGDRGWRAPSDVIIVDCNDGRVRACQELGVLELPGLTDFLAGSCSLEDIIRETATPQLKVMPVGASPDALSVVIASTTMRDLLDAARQRFALVVLDLPSALSGADTQAVTPLIDYMLFVVRSGKASQKNIATALDLVDRQKLIGAVLNDSKRTLPNWIDQLL